MMATRAYVILALALCFALAYVPGHAVRAQSGEPTSKITVAEGKKLTFDPKTCAEGSNGHVSTGNEGAMVRVLGRRGGFCEFEYLTDGCGGGGSLYLCQVPVDSGPVTVEVKSVTDGKTSSTQIVNSFPLEKMKLMRRQIGGRTEIFVGDTGAFVAYHAGERRNEMVPAKGDKAKFRFRVYADREFKDPLADAFQDQAVEFVVGSGKGWGWLEPAMEHMTVGDRRQVFVPEKIADGARKWVPDPKPGSTLYLEMSLVSLERSK